MTKKRRTFNLKNLKPADLRTLRRAHRKWQATIKPMQDAIRRSTQITGDDLKIIVRGRTDPA